MNHECITFPKYIFLLFAIFSTCTINSFINPPHSLFLPFNRKEQSRRSAPFLTKLLLSSLSTSEKYIATGTSTIHNSGDVDEFLSDELVKSIDLKPLVETISLHCGTRRGRDALLSLVGSDETASKNKLNDILSSRQRRAMNVGMERNSIKTNAVDESETISLFSPLQSSVRVASSLEEARVEWDLVEEAMSLLLSNREDNGEIKNNPLFQRKGCEIPIPPIYDATSSVWDTQHMTDTDDDEWLQRPLGNEISSSLSLSFERELENILRADQVCKRLLAVKKWSDDIEQTTGSSTDANFMDSNSLSLFSYPGLFSIAKDINKEVIQSLSKDISNSVIIVRGEKTYMDPTGIKSFSFRLNPEKYPALFLLRRKEKILLEKMDASMRKSLELGLVNGVSNKKDGAVVKEIISIREELDVVEKEISESITFSILSKAKIIDNGLDVVARLDVILAKAAFGIKTSGVVPFMGNCGIINVKQFLHPVLAIRSNSYTNIYMNKSEYKTVPIDLIIGSNVKNERKALLISGPNGGGKTLAMKSFGLVAAMARLAIPIPLRPTSRSTRRETRVDFFKDVFTEVGDGQNVSEGESTLMARLNSCATIIEKLYNSELAMNNNAIIEDKTEIPQSMHSLLLIDEMGGGTDPETGGALAQSILETIMSYDFARIVATTHSPRLKALSFEDDRFQCATVLLRDRTQTDNEEKSKFKIPTYQLLYGLTGDSYALGAAARCCPSLPDNVLIRAAEILAEGGTADQDDLRASTASIDRRELAAIKDAVDAENYRKEMKECREATISLALAYVQHFERLEKRLNLLVHEIKNDPSKDTFDIIGETIEQLRAVKRKVKSAEELLKERGLRKIPYDYEFKRGEQVVVISPGEWEGETLSVAADQKSATKAQVVVEPSYQWGSSLSFNTFSDPDPFNTNANKTTSLSLNFLLNRTEVALWDFPNDNDWGSSTSWKQSLDESPVRSVLDSRRKLYNTLNNLKLKSSNRGVKEYNTDPNNVIVNRTSSDNINKNNEVFISSRARKAAAKRSKKKGQRNK